MRALQPGDPTEIGGYQLRAHLGGGGMGTVYLASTLGGRLVAVKSIRSELIADGEFQARFRLEVRAARQVRGLYTAELLDADPDAVPPWLVTAYVPGPSLAQAVKTQGPVPGELVPLLMAGVAEALIDIHAAGIVHRDLKPSNVLLSPDGPRVIDFGIAKALDSSKLTLTGVTMGSAECMTPEQVHGLPVTPATDVFSLGSLGVYAASGRLPFDAPNSAAMMYRVVNEDPVLDGCPAELRLLFESCFSKDPDGRPSPAEVLETCRTLMTESAAVFPQAWRPGPDGSTGGLSDLARAEELVPIGDARSAAFGRVPPALDEAAPGPGSAGEPLAPGWDSPAGGWGSPARGWVAAGTRQDPAFDARPAPTRTAPPEPKPRSARRPVPRPPAEAWLMYGAATLAAVALIVGLVTVPSLRTALGQRYPGSTGQQIATAANLAVVVIIIRALTSAGMWLWAAQAVSRGHRRARTIACVALAVCTLDLASSLLGLSTSVAADLILAGWIAGLAAVAVAWPRRLRR